MPELFAGEDYPTLVQMTSQVTGRLRGAVGWEAIFRALFPCGSVTGAPKIRAMEIIHELEAGPRGAYCGSVGFIAPDGDAAFSVAIRTAVLEDGNLRYDVGSGVVLDSDGADEYAECLLKSAVFDAPSEAAVETLRGDASGVFVRRDRHAQRLSDARPGASLDDALSSLPETGAPQRVRVAVSADGTVDLQSQSLEALPEPLTLALSRYALTPAVQRTDIKTSRRDFYDGERARVSALCGADEVLFRNEDGLMMEGSFTTLFVQSGGRLLTPRTPGLLPGVLRAEMLERGLASEADITLPVLLASEAVYVGNSLRGLIRAELSGPDPV